MTTIKSFVATLSALALLTAIPASALTVATGVIGSTNVNVGTGVSVDTGTNVSVGLNGEGSASAQEFHDSFGHERIGKRERFDERERFGPARRDPRGRYERHGTGFGRLRCERSNQGQPLRLYRCANTELATRIFFCMIDTASDHVAVTYPEHAELFGFIPVTVDTTATTDASGNVSISAPWWSFLAAIDQSNLQANVQSNVSARSLAVTRKRTHN